jgi:hypothetical protein
MAEIEGESSYISKGTKRIKRDQPGRGAKRNKSQNNEASSDDEEFGQVDKPTSSRRKRGMVRFLLVNCRKPLGRT